jgi:F-type H+-transporting ATPase subunit beta
LESNLTILKKKGLGKIISVQGPVVDVCFKNNEDMPSMYDVIEVKTINGDLILLQTKEHLSSNTVRTVALMDTLNLQLNAVCYNTFQPITIPMVSLSTPASTSGGRRTTPAA